MKILNYLLILTIFLDAFLLFEVPVNIYGYYIIYALFLFIYVVWYNAIKIPLKFFFIVSCLTLIGLVATTLYGEGIGLVIKQFILISFVSVAFYLLIRVNNYDLLRLLEDYVDVAFIVSLLGLVQELFFIFGISGRYEYRVTSIVSEPAHLAIALTPAFYVGIGYFLNKKRGLYLSSKKLAVIFTCYILTFSGVAFIGVALSLMIYLLQKYIFNFRTGFLKRLILASSILVALSFFLVSVYQIPGIRMRVDDTVSVLSTEGKIPANKINLSTFALYSNFMVTKEALKNNFLFGSGLGTHAINYDKYVGEFFPEDYVWRKMEINREDANSLMLRLLSETGVLGTALFLFLVFTNVIPFKESHLKDSVIFHLWLINNGILASIILRLIRFGNYTVLGFPFFLFLFFLSYKAYRKIAYKNKQLLINNDEFA